MYFGPNRKRVCNFLLVRHSNLGPILHRFGDIAGFYVLLTAPVFYPNFGGVSVSPDRPRNNFRSIPTYVSTAPVRYRRTDRRHSVA